MINYSIWFFWSFFDFLHSNVPHSKCCTEVVHAIFYMHQTSGKCASMRMCDHTHQMDKTVFMTIICYQLPKVVSDVRVCLQVVTTTLRPPTQRHNKKQKNTKPSTDRQRHVGQRHMTNMSLSQGNKKIAIRKLPATNNFGSYQ